MVFISIDGYKKYFHILFNKFLVFLGNKEMKKKK